MHVVKIEEVGTNAAGLVDKEPRRDFVGENRLTERCQAGELSFMTPWNEPERRGHRLIGVAEAVGRQRREQTLLAAVDRRQRAVGEMSMAVIDRVAAAIGGDKQRVVPVRVERRRQRVRLVMIIEIDLRIAAEAAGAPEFGDFENVVDAQRLIAQKFRRHVAPRVFLGVLSIFFANPAHAANRFIKCRRKFRAAEADDIGILTRRSGDRKHFVDGEIGMLAAIAFGASRYARSE